MFLHYLQLLSWLLLLFLQAAGLGSLVARLESRRSPSLTETLTSGIAATGLLYAFLLFAGIFHTASVSVLLFVGIFFGAKPLYLHARQIPAFFKAASPVEKSLFVLIALVLAGGFFHMLAPSGGQESFQYHYFLPVLYVEQQTLFLSGYELYDALFNFWGYEVLLAGSEWAGGLLFMQMQVFMLFVLFALQIHRGTFLLYESRLQSLFATLFALTATVYTYFFWWTKPELVMTGTLFLLLTVWLRDKNPGWLSGSLMTVWFLSLKITSVGALPIFALFWFLTRRKDFIWTGKYLSLCLILSLPWILFFLNSEGGLGALPSTNPAHFAAPEPASDFQSVNLNHKYLQDLKFYLLLFKPAVYLFLPGLFLFLLYYKKYGLLVLGFLFNLIIARMMIGMDTYYADEFRYAGYTFFVIPVGAGVIAGLLSRRRVIGWGLVVLLAYLSYSRVSIQASQTWKFYSSFLTGSQSLQSALAREGGIHFQAYLDSRKSKTEKLLHIGHGNYAVHGDSVIHAGSWSGRYPFWKYTREEFLSWCHENSVRYVLVERRRYQTYSRGFGGREYSGSSLSRYYKLTLELMEKFAEFEQPVSNADYALIRLPKLQPLQKKEEKAEF